METKISMDDYREIESSVDSNMSEEKLIEVHKMLVGKSSKGEYREIEDCGVEFISEFLDCDRKTIVYEYSKEAKKFINSKYLSDYFKASIREFLSDKDLSIEVLNALNSDKLINEMSEEEITAIYMAIKPYLPRIKNNAANSFMQLLYKLNGTGVISFIKNNISTTDLARHILVTSGVGDRASYYSGRGVNYGDLNENNLVAIFNKLLNIDADYAMNFVEMVRKMKTLGATEFINSFMSFAACGFKVERTNIVDSNVSFDGAYGKARDALALASVLSVMGRSNDQSYQISASEQMKRAFMLRIRPVLLSINPNYDGLISESFNTELFDTVAFDSGYPRIRR